MRKIVCIVLLAMSLNGCSERLLTEQLWQTDAQYYVLEKNAISAAQLNELHDSADGYKLIETQEKFYIKKNWINYYGYFSAKLIATPLAVSLDMAHIYIVGAVSDPQLMINVISAASSKKCR